MDSSTWQQHLQHLLDAGAELVVTDPDGAIVFTAPVARAWRLDDDDVHCLWLRPLAPPVRGHDGTTVFALSRCRRRALAFHRIDPSPQALTMPLRTGQHARIHAATGSAAETLQAWDTFVGARLSAAEEIELDALAEDSWTGRYA